MSRQVGPIVEERRETPVVGEYDVVVLGGGLEPVGNTPGEFDTFIRTEIDKWSKVVKASGAKLD